MLLSAISNVKDVSVLSTIPFVLMLASIALFPIFASHFWEKNKNKLIIASILSFPIVFYLILIGNSSKLFETVFFDFVPFLILLGSLFIITGGIYIDGDLEASPKINTVFLAIGAVLASFIGTTGASMLLIRPIISTNKERQFKVHTILFFIGIVSNCGGLMTPLGDPPLFVLYLRGVPFFWFFNLAKDWLFTNILLVVLYYFIDTYYYKRESKRNIKIDKINVKPISLIGSSNIIWLLGVILSVAFINEQFLPFISYNHYFRFIREGAIIFFAIMSLIKTPNVVRIANNFSFAPIYEVAFLFIGIFITMVPCLIFLSTNAQSLGINNPIQFYFASGFLSSFLDNTPTAVTFHSLALSLKYNCSTVLIAGIPVTILKAISLGSVLFGSMTYIGNGPNFMVKSIAEENGIKMPHFFKYIYSFSLVVLFPIFILVAFFFI